MLIVFCAKRPSKEGPTLGGGIDYVEFLVVWKV